MTDKGIKYAEETLGVHEVYSRAIEARKRFEQARNDLARLRAARRSVDHTLRDREYEVLSDVRGANSTASLNAIERLVKDAVQTDPACRATRDELDRLAFDIDMTENAAQLAKVDAEIESSRMTELGGYLTFLASIKAAAHPATGTAVPWPGVDS